MARTGPLHWVGVFFLLAAAILLLITTISAPVINDIALLKVTLTNQSALRNSSVTFGTFGYCVLDVAPPQTDQDYCTSKTIGYNPAVEMALVDGTGFSTVSSGTADGLTRVMILHPIACGVAFIAFLLSCGAGVVGSLLGAVVAGIAFIITLVVLATDFVWTGIIRNAVNSDGSGSSASFSVGIWTLLAAFILLFFGMFIVLFTCFSARRQKKRDRAAYKAETTTTTKRHFWQRNRY
jgi:MFS family permease